MPAQYSMSTDDKKTELAKTLEDNLPVSAREIDDQVESIMGLFGMQSVDKALAKSNWSIEEEVAILASIARGECDAGLGYTEPPSHTERRLAASELRRIAKDAIEASGGVVRATATRRLLDEDGNHIDQHVEQLRMSVMPKLQKTSQLLDQGLNSKETINHPESEEKS